MNRYVKLTTAAIISLTNTTLHATEVSMEEHETRLLEQASSSETNITINGNDNTYLKPSTDLYLTGGTYRIYNKNEKSKNNWNNITVSDMDLLVLNSAFPRMTTYDLISGDGTSALEIENGHEVTIDNGTRVRKIVTDEPMESNNVKITNNGNILDVGELYILENTGYANVTDDISEIENKKTGIIVISDDTAGTIVRNSGEMTLLDVAALTVTPSEVKKAEITNDGVMTLIGVLEMWGDSELRNSGTIHATGEGLISPGGEEGTTAEIYNTGVIRGERTVIYVLPDGKHGQGQDSVHIHNAGTIIGDIEDNEKNDYAIVMTNERGGKWSSSFTGHKVEDTGNGEPKYLTITNNGSISTIKNTGGKSGEIKTKQITNNGEIDIRQGPLTIHGDYQAGTGARIVTGGALLGDETIIPTLTINGRVDGGTTHVRVDNLGGTGSETRDGILVVRADTVDGEGFTKEGRIVAGAYDYDLVRVESGDHTEWRLTSALTPEPPGPVPPVPPGPVPPGPVPPAPVRVVRPEAVTYAENLRQANTLFMTDSEQRRAVGEYTDPVTGRTETSSLWLSQTGGHSARHDASGQLKSDYNRYTVQLGGTLLSLPAGDDGRLEAGVQGGYGHARGNTRSGLTGYRARGTVSGYSTGLYGTWRQHRDGQSGAYVSTTLQYSWLKNQVKGDDLAAEKYDARGTTLSLEGGYDYAVWQGGEQNGDSLFIRPHAQVTRMGVKADEHSEANGTRVRQQGDGSVFSRTGVRVWLDKAVSKGQRVQPFVETNWLHNTRDFCSSMNGVRDCQAGNRNQAEVLAGVRGDVSPDVAVTAQAGGRFGSQASRDLAGTLNVSVKF